MILEIEKHKKILRERMKSLCLAAKKEKISAEENLCDKFVENFSFPQETKIATYISLKDEIETSTLNRALLKLGHKLCLPVMAGKNALLEFRLWGSEAKLAKGCFGIFEPLPSSPLIEPDVMLVPLRAFDKKCNRLGRGGAHYDRTIFALREKKKIVAIGLAFSCQEVESVPTREHDQLLDAVVTEERVFWKK